LGASTKVTKRITHAEDDFRPYTYRETQNNLVGGEWGDFGSKSRSWWKVHGREKWGKKNPEEDESLGTQLIGWVKKGEPRAGRTIKNVKLYKCHTRLNSQEGGQCHAGTAAT